MRRRDEIIEQQIPALRRYAYGLTRNSADADDLVQACLERAISRRELLRSESAVRPWLFRILSNLFVNQIRRARSRPEVVGIDVPDIAGCDGDPERAAELREVLDAVGGLEPDRRTVLLLVSVEGFSYAEAAEMTGVPIGTVMSRLAWGRAELRQKLDHGRRPALRRVK